MPTRYKGTTEQTLALNTVIKLARSLNALQAKLIPPLQRDFGITESQFAVLEALLHVGPLSQGELCQKILRSGSNVTTVVDNLERDGLVTRARHETDRRVQIVQLTEKGRDLVRRAFPEHLDRIVNLLSTLTTEEQRELKRICGKLGHAVSTRDE